MKTRIPHLGHTALFFGLVVLALVVVEAAAVVFLPGPYTSILLNARLQLIAEGAAYVLALLAAALLLPAFWREPLLTGIGWRGRGVRWWLIPAGLALGFMAQAAETRLPIPKALPMDALLHDRALIPALATLAILVAPLMEEIFFRGFLLPALANAYDFVRLPTLELPAEALATHEAWRTAPPSTSGLLLASTLTSVLFALIHAPQLGYTWPAVSLLFAVSLVLCAVRIRLHSVAASTLVHGCYNLSIFFTLAYVSGGFRHMDRL